MENHPQRKSPRLKDYDYTQEGVYFVTICTARRIHLFGNVVEGEMRLNPLGKIAYQELQHIPQRWQTVAVDLFVVMPNHVHVIIVLVGTAFLPDIPKQFDDVGTRFFASDMADTHKPDTKNGVPTLGRVVGSYKAGVTRLARKHQILDDTAGMWQGRYHDHIIRDEHSLNNLRRYVEQNPARWQEDVFLWKGVGTRKIASDDTNTQKPDAKNGVPTKPFGNAMIFRVRHNYCE